MAPNLKISKKNEKKAKKTEEELSLSENKEKTQLNTRSSKRISKANVKESEKSDKMPAKKNVPKEKKTAKDSQATEIKIQTGGDSPSDDVLKKLRSIPNIKSRAEYNEAMVGKEKKIKKKPVKDKSKSKTVVKKNIVKEIKKTLKKKRRVKRAAVKKRSREGRGVIYLGHIPHGFYENEMKKYFSQFGLVTNIALSRSKRSGRSQGFAFIEFLSREVAKIAAESMNNYIMFSRVLKCELLPESKKVTFFEPIEKMPGVEQNRVFHNEPDEEDETVAQKKFKKRAGKVNKQIKKLKDLGLFVPIEPVKL